MDALELAVARMAVKLKPKLFDERTLGGAVPKWRVRVLVEHKSLVAKRLETSVDVRLQRLSHRGQAVSAAHADADQATMTVVRVQP